MLVLAALVALAVGLPARAVAQTPPTMASVVAGASPAQLSAFDAIIRANYSAPELSRLSTVATELGDAPSPTAQRVRQGLMRARFAARALPAPPPLAVALTGFTLGYSVGGWLNRYFGITVPGREGAMTLSGFWPFAKWTDPAGVVIAGASVVACTAHNPSTGGTQNLVPQWSDYVLITQQQNPGTGYVAGACRAWDPSFLQDEFRPTQYMSTSMWADFTRLRNIEGVVWRPVHAPASCFNGTATIACPSANGVVPTLPDTDATVTHDIDPANIGSLPVTHTATTTAPADPASSRAAAVAELDKPGNEQARGWVIWAIDPDADPDENPLLVTIPAPQTGETAEAYLSRLQALGLVGTITTLAEADAHPSFGPSAIVSVYPAPGTRHAPATAPEVQIRRNPETAPQPPGTSGTTPGLGAPPAACGPWVDPNVDFSVLTTGCTGKFPCGIWTWITDVLGPPGASEAPEWDVSGIPGARPGQTLSFAGMAPQMATVRTVLAWAGSVLMVWWLSRSLLGLGRKESSGDD